MPDKSDTSDEQRFNEALQRMLTTPPQPHDKKDNEVRRAKSGKRASLKRDR